MRPSRIVVGAAVVGAALAAVAVVKRPPAVTPHGNYWRTVTILRSPDEIAPGGVYPQPIADLGDAVEVRMTPAPGDRGTELSVRIRHGEPSGLSLDEDDPRAAVRLALRQAKQLVEAGETAVVEPRPHGPRRATPQGALLDYVAKRTEGTGVL
jgi:hypothetical protein